MDEDTRIQLGMIAAQARAIAAALGRSKAETLFQADYTPHEVVRLIEEARKLLGDSPAAGRLPEQLYELGRYTTPKSAVMAMAEGLAVAIQAFLSQEPGNLEELQRENEALETKVLEAEARAVTIVDDELRDRCVDLLLRPGRADAAVRDACVVLENRLRNVAGLPKQAIGVHLVDQALKKREGVLVVSDVEPEQEGIHFLFRGVIGFFKNPPSHRLIEDYDVTRARQIVGLIDTLLCLLRDARKRAADSGGPA